MAAIGAELLVETLDGLAKGMSSPVPQDDSQATLAPILKKEDGQIDFSRTAKEIHNRLRGFQPWPGAFTQYRGKTLKIVAAEPASANLEVAPGQIYLHEDQLLAGCAGGTLLALLQLQPEGKKAISARDFISGYRPGLGRKAGEKLGKSPAQAGIKPHACCSIARGGIQSIAACGTRISYAVELLHSGMLEGLEPADRNLTTEIVMGVLRWRSVLDQYIAHFSFSPLPKLDLEVLTALRMGAYQIKFLRVAPHAAVNETVELVKQARKLSAAGLANAVMRKILALQNRGKQLALPRPPEIFAHPEWMTERWTKQFGEETLSSDM